MKKKVQKVVLAYSGGLDTSVIIRWLIKKYDCEVVAFVADLGQGEELGGIKEKAIQTGAAAVFVEDLRDEFARDYIFPMFRGAALYEGTYLLGTSIARPLIAKKQLEIADRVGADAVAHGATGKGNDQVRFELAVQALRPDLQIIAPWREWEFKSRSDLINYASKHGIPVPVTQDKPYSCDRNLLHISYEGGILEDPWCEPDETMFILTSSPETAPDQPVSLEIIFEAGMAVAVDGQQMSPAVLLAHLNQLAGKHGVGRVDVVENRFVGMKSRGVYETPGGTVIYAAARALEGLTLDREVLHLRNQLVPDYARLVYNGFWFSPERVTLQHLMDDIQKDVSGVVRVKLYKGTVRIVGRKSPQSLLDQDYSTFEEDRIYDQRDAAGFIKLHALRLKIAQKKGRDLGWK